MKTVLTIVFTGLITLGLTACNTMAGFGKDMQIGGEKITQAAQKDQ